MGSAFGFRKGGRVEMVTWPESPWIQDVDREREEKFEPQIRIVLSHAVYSCEDRSAFWKGTRPIFLKCCDSLPCLRFVVHRRPRVKFLWKSSSGSPRKTLLWKPLLARLRGFRSWSMIEQKRITDWARSFGGGWGQIHFSQLGTGGIYLLMARWLGHENCYCFGKRLKNGKAEMREKRI